MNKRFVKPLKEFLESGCEFRIIYHTKISTPLITESIKRVCVLDSSFNPPHLGHLSLALKSLIFNYEDSGTNISIPVVATTRVLILLLSVKNADKHVPQPASFEDRIEMMAQFADSISHKYNIKTVIGLTNHAKFVDKARAIENVLSKGPNSLRFTFPIGFDTLIRIFNPKYYVPFALEHALDKFMEKNDLFCLTRDDGTHSSQDQFDYLAAIQQGLKTDIPKEWAKNIFLVKGDDSTLLISSSSIRKNVANGIAVDTIIPETSRFLQEHRNIYNL